MGGVTRSKLNNEFLSDLDRNIKILEVGCNIGNQLKMLQGMGFKDLWGIEISDYTLKLAIEQTERMNLIKASVLNIPFKDRFFDLVFTSGVLIHIHPNDLPKAIDEVYRITKRYIWGYEYFSEKCQEIEYRGRKELLWKNNFKKEFIIRHSDLQVIKEKKLKYLDNDNVDEMYLLKKK